MARLDIQVVVNSEYYFCPLCEAGVHVHVLARLTNGDPFLDTWTSVDSQPVPQPCIDWCRDKGTPVSQDDWSRESWTTSDTQWCAVGMSEVDMSDRCRADCTADFECDICLCCKGHCNC